MCIHIKGVYHFFDSHPNSQEDKSYLVSFEESEDLIAYLKSKFRSSDTFEINGEKKHMSKRNEIWNLRTKLKKGVNISGNFRKDQISNESPDQTDERHRYQRQFRKDQILNESQDQSGERFRYQQQYNKAKISNETEDSKRIRIQSIKDKQSDKVNEQYLKMYEHNQQIIKRSDRQQKNKELAEEKQREFNIEFLHYRQDYFENLEKSKEKLDKILLNFFYLSVAKDFFFLVQPTNKQKTYNDIFNEYSPTNVTNQIFCKTNIRHRREKRNATK